MRKKISGKVIFNAAVIILSVGLIVYFCLSENGLVDLAKNIDGFKKGWLVLALCGMLGDLFLDAVLIYLFTRASDKRYTMRGAAKSCMVGHFYSAVTPFQSGGQPMQIYVMSKQGVDAGISTSALVQKFLVYQSCLVAYSAVAILFRFKFFSENLSGGILGIALIGFLIQAFVIIMILLFSFNRPLTHRILTWLCGFLFKIHLLRDYESAIETLETQLDYFHESNKKLYRHKKLLLVTCVLTLMQQTSLFAVSYCVYRAFNIGFASPADMIFAQAFVTMVSSMVPLPGAAGASEGSFYLFFSMFFTGGTIKSAVLLWRIFSYYAVILVSAPFCGITKKMQERGKKHRQNS